MKVEFDPKGIRLGGWNHRVVRRVLGLGVDNVELAIHEAHYDGPADDTVDDPIEGIAVLEERRARGERLPLDRKPHSITMEPVAVQGDSIKELRETLERMLRCLDKPALDYETREEITLTQEEIGADGNDDTYDARL